MQLKCFIIISFVIFICPTLTTTYRASRALIYNTHNCFSGISSKSLRKIHDVLSCEYFSWSLQTKIVAILGIHSSQRFKDQQLYVIYKYITSSNIGFVANITY